MEGLSVNGKLLVPAAPAEPLTVTLMPLISGRRSVAGCYSGTARDSQDTLKFSVLNGVHPMIEKYPLSRVAEAYEQMHSGKARFRAVLTLGTCHVAACTLTKIEGTDPMGSREAISKNTPSVA